ncbi:hypothetical protein [Candidatus Entotheonella palauensis]|uniref:hypothetical protein n=1 Tax=Candidatus Entotheonella palauensis TaxID=93172 RepID=UPI000B7CB10B|nr:hypothetical protein [Candidatus Entotheonella palauensis]
MTLHSEDPFHFGRTDFHIHTRYSSDVSDDYDAIAVAERLWDLGKTDAMVFKHGLIKHGYLSGYDDPRVLEAAHQIGRAASRHGVAIEVNNKMAGQPGYAHAVAAFAQEGVMFSLASDSHTRRRVGVTTDSERVLHDCGMTADRLATAAMLQEHRQASGARA